MNELQHDFSSLEKSGKLQIFGKDLNEFPIIVWTGNRHVTPRTDQEYEQEINFFIYFFEKAIQNGY